MYQILNEAASQQTSLDPLIVMVVGMAVVFLGLVILIAVVKLVNVICRAVFGEKTHKAAVVPENPGANVGVTRASELTDAQRGEIIAAISTVIAESMGKPVSGIRIRSIRKVG